jgi:hypothetical protein
MRRRITLAMTLGLAMALAAVAPALAGGWADAALDPAPPRDDGGTTVIGFTLLQHGLTPVDWGNVMVVARNEATGKSVQGEAKSDGGSHWTARLALPSDGSWSLTVRHGELEVTAAQPLSVSVGSMPAAAAATPAPATSGIALILVLIGLMAVPVVGGVAMLLAVSRRREVQAAAG